MGSSPSQIYRASVLSKLDITETLADAPGMADSRVTQDDLNPGARAYSQTTTPPAKYYYAREMTLAGSGLSSEELDLAALPSLQGDFDATGLKLQVLRLQGEAGNDAITFGGGDDDPYEPLGAGVAIELPAGWVGPLQCEFNDASPEVTSAGSGVNASTLKIAGTGGDTIKVEMIFG